MIMITIIIICITVKVSEAAQVWGIVLKIEAGETGEGQIMKSFAAPEGAMEEHFRVL